jgi:hypothetical protein
VAINFIKCTNVFKENPSVVITQSRNTVTRPSNVQSYKIFKLFYHQISVVITLELTWPNDKQQAKFRYKTNIKYWQCQKGKADIRKWHKIIRIILITHWLQVGGSGHRHFKPTHPLTTHNITMHCKHTFK